MEPRRRHRRSTRLLMGLAAGVGGLVILIALISHPHQVGSYLNHYVYHGLSRFSHWAARHPHDAVIICGLFGVAGVAGYVSHKLGRWTSWMFMTVLVTGAWLLYWIVPQARQFNDTTVHLQLSQPSINSVAAGLAIIITIVHWPLEAVERYKRTVEH